jgi:hypothetical protein
MAYGKSKWMVLTVVFGIVAAWNGGLAYVQNRMLTAQLSAALDEVRVSHDEVANLKTKVGTLQARISSTQ